MARVSVLIFCVIFCTLGIESIASNKAGSSPLSSSNSRGGSWPQERSSTLKPARLNINSTRFALATPATSVVTLNKTSSRLNSNTATNSNNQPVWESGPCKCRAHEFSCTEPGSSGRPKGQVPLSTKNNGGQPSASGSKNNGLIVEQCSCIPLALVCDSNIDCENGEDEAHCGESPCAGMRCPGEGVPHRCIQPEWLCDGDDDCGDNSDESNCGERNCTASSFRCSNGNCIPQKWVCDGDPDCDGGSDERGCQPTTQRTCQPSEHQCGNDACIPAEWRCDRDPDCRDMSDESGCDTKEHDCLPSEFQCTTGHCVKQEYRCDGEIHCTDLSDELDCGSEAPPCQDGDFRCPDGQCIAQAWKCDGEPDCQQGADEEGCEGQVSGSCGPNQMACTSVPSCISSSWVCDGEPDCHDGEDEAKCPAQCSRDQFACSNETCIGREHLCNGVQDCPNGEDELKCTVPKDCEANSRCQHSCVTNSNGTSACACRSGYKLNDDGYSCSDVDECASEAYCSQLCSNTVGGFHCDCTEGYVLRPDGFTCKALGPPVHLIFANRVDIRQLSLFEEEYTSVIEGLQNAIALDFHHKQKLIVWSDVTLDSIKIANLNGTNVRDVIWWGLESPGGVAVDWIHDHIYWTDSGTRRVEVCTLNGSYRKPLMWENVEKPRAIAVHPGQAAIFWTDWGQMPRIERADMDGSNRAILVSENVVWPNGLTVDYSIDRIYWADAKHHVVESVRLDGTGRRRVIERGLPHPFAITLFEDFLFWTDWHTKSIHQANKMTGSDMRTVRSNLHFPMDIHSYHPTRQPKYVNRCGSNNGGCSHLCLPNRTGFSCLCPAGLFIKADGRTCSESPSELLVFAQKSEIRLFVLNATGDTDHVLPLRGVRSAVALDWDGSSESIFWTDVETDVISRAFWNGTRQRSIVSSDLESPAGLAVDWVTKKLYWTDAGTNRIEVSNLDGSMRSLLVWEGLDKPRDIVVDPVGGYMYWTDWGQTPKIERAGMDGSHRSTIVNTNLTWPNGLAIDHEGERLYWADGGTKTIEYATLDGKQRTVLIGAELPHPFGLALYEDLIFWSDWDTTSIHSTDKLDAKRPSVLRSGLKGLMDVRVYHSNRYSVPSLCQSHNGGCSHLCLLAPLPAGQTCACPTGIRLMPDGRTCEKEPSTSLIFSHQSYIRRMSFDMPYRIDSVLNITLQKNIVALDVDIVTGFIYWSDTVQTKILRSLPDGSSFSEVIVYNLQVVEGLAVDPVGRKLYWTDAGRRSLEVANMDGSHQKVLIWTGMEKPRGLVLHYAKGIMFWTDWGKQPRIEQADMDGRNRKVLVSTDIGWPNSIAIDKESNLLYWTDAQKKSIESCDFGGQNRRVVISGLSHPYGLTVLDDYIYWTDWNTKSVQRVEKNTGLDRSTIRGGLGNLMEIKTWRSRAVGAEMNSCGTNNGGCSHLCLRSSGGRGFTCACPTGIRMTENGFTCQALPNTFLLYASRSTLSRISLDTPEHWDVALLLGGVHNAVGVDFHWAKKKFFYTDVYLDVIRSVDAYNVSNVTTIVSTNLTTPDGIAVDWLADNIYWTDTGRNVLEAARIDGTCRKIIIAEGLDEPRAVAVFPQRGWLYWTDWGNVSKIERSFLDGSSRQAIVTTELGWPNGLAIDYDGQRLYWADAKLDRIETADLSGSFRVQLVHGASHPFGLAQLDDNLYWTDWRSKSIERVDKATGKQRSVLREGLDGLMEIRAVSENKQTGRNPCSENNGACSHLCLYRVTSYVCACPDAPDPAGCSTRIVPLKDAAKSSLADDSLNSPVNGSSRSESAMHPSMIVLLIFGILSLFVLIGILLHRWHRRRFQNCGPLQPQQVSVLTFANPNYSSSVPDVVVADKKTFSWQRWKYDRNQERVYDIQEDKQSHLEAASLIPHSLPPPEAEVDLEVETDIVETSSPGPTPSGTPPPTPPQRLDSMCM